MIHSFSAFKMILLIRSKSFSRIHLNHHLATAASLWRKTSREDQTLLLLLPALLLLGATSANIYIYIFIIVIVIVIMKTTTIIVDGSEILRHIGQYIMTCTPRTPWCDGAGFQSFRLFALVPIFFLPMLNGQHDLCTQI